jgi:hypothetical protein
MLATGKTVSPATPSGSRADAVSERLARGDRTRSSGLAARFSSVSARRTWWLCVGCRGLFVRERCAQLLVLLEIEFAVGEAPVEDLAR